MGPEVGNRGATRAVRPKEKNPGLQIPAEGAWSSIVSELLPVPSAIDRRSFEPLVAGTVIAPALFDPFHAPIAVGRLVGIVLIDTGVHARLTGRFRSVYWRNLLG
jgi:hypothetical protein